MKDIGHFPQSLLDHPSVAKVIDYYNFLRDPELNTDPVDLAYFHNKACIIIRSVIKSNRAQFQRHHCFEAWDAVWENLWEIASGWKASYAA